MIGAEFLTGFQVCAANGAIIEIPVVKARALLAFLALDGRRTYHRNVLAALLWDTPSDRHARQSFRRCLHDLRSALGTAAREVLVVDGETIGLRREAINVDVLEFRDLVAARNYAAAAEMIVDGDLLENLEVGTEQFDDWLSLERRRHCDVVVETLLANAENFAKCNRLDIAGTFAERCLKFDPYCERAHRLLIDYYVVASRPEAARRQYARLVHLAHDGLELGCASTADTGFGKRARSTYKKSQGHPAIYLKSMVTLGPEDALPGLGEGLLDDLSREISRYRSAVPTRHESLADYIIDSSVRNFAGQFKVSFNLLHAATGTLVWSEAFTGAASDLLVAQQNIAAMSANRVMNHVARHENKRCNTSDTERNAYTLWQLGLKQRLSYTKASNGEAKRLCTEAIKLDPEFAAAYVTLSEVETMDAFFGYSGERQACLDRARSMANAAIAIDPSYPFAYAVLAKALARVMDFDGAAVAAERSLDLCPSLSDAHYALGISYYYSGQPIRALEAAKKAISLDPLSPQLWSRHQLMARSFFDLGQFDCALRQSHMAVNAPNAKDVAFALKAAAARKAGDSHLARMTVSELLRRNPNFTSGYVVQHLGNDFIQDHVADLADTLNRCGMPP